MPSIGRYQKYIVKHSQSLPESTQRIYILVSETDEMDETPVALRTEVINKIREHF